MPFLVEMDHGADDEKFARAKSVSKRAAGGVINDQDHAFVAAGEFTSFRITIKSIASVICRAIR